MKWLKPDAGVVASGLLLILPLVYILVDSRYSLLDAAAILLLLSFFAVGCLFGYIIRLWPWLRTLGLSLLLILAAYELKLGPVLVQDLRTQVKSVAADFFPMSIVLDTAIHWLAALGPILLLILTVKILTAWRRGHTLISVVVGATMASLVLLPSTGRPHFTERGKLSGTAGNLPPILIFVLDAQIGLTGLDDGDTEAARAKSTILRTLKDFEIFPNAYSRYAMTYLSLGAAYNFTAFADIPPVFGEKDDYFDYRLTRNYLAANFGDLGYQTVFLQTDHLNTCANVADYCYTISKLDLSSILRRGLNIIDHYKILFRFITRPYLAKITQVRLTKRASILSPSAITIFDKLETMLGGGGSGLAIFTHLLMPHGQHIFARDCSVILPDVWFDYRESFDSRNNRYLRQMQCAFHKLTGIFRQMKQNGNWSDATIIVMGDHGSRILQKSAKGKLAGKIPMSEPEKIAVFSTLFAVKSAKTTARLNPMPVEIQTSLGKFFGVPRLGTVKPKGKSLVGPWVHTPKRKMFTAITLPDRFQRRKLKPAKP